MQSTIFSSVAHIYLGYRYQRSGRGGGGVFTFSTGYAESQRRQEEHAERVAHQNAEYEKRKRELGKSVVKVYERLITGS